MTLDDVIRTVREPAIRRPQLRGGRVRPMTRADIPAVGRMFFRTFREKTIESPPEFNAYFARAFFDSPAYSPEIGSIVHETPAGDIDAALSVVPMHFIANGRPLEARLLCAFMEETGTRHGGAAQLMLTVRARLQDFCFTDSAAPVSADLCGAIGGSVLPVQSLEWRRIFRPVRWGAGMMRRRFAGRTSLGALLTPFDAAMRRVFSAFRQPQPERTTAGPLSREEFLEAAPRFVSHFAVRPQWSHEELGWLLDMAGLNKTEGPLTLRAVRNTEGMLIGCFACYGRPGDTAHVLNVLCISGYEMETITQMFADLDASGFIAARGMAQPFLMESMLRHRATTFRYRGYFCIASRHKDVRDAILQGNIYIGGLAGETWSRLLTDFR